MPICILPYAGDVPAGDDVANFLSPTMQDAINKISSGVTWPKERYRVDLKLKTGFKKG